MPRELTIRKAGKPVCFCCNHNLDSCIGEEHTGWEAPGGGIIFMDGGNYGSRLIDSAFDGHRYAILICDECAEYNAERIQEYDTPGYEEARDKQSFEILDGMANDPNSFLADPTTSYHSAVAAAITERLRAGEDCSCLSADEITIMEEWHGSSWREAALITPPTPEQQHQEYLLELEKEKLAHRRRLIENARAILTQAEKDGLL